MATKDIRNYTTQAITTGDKVLGIDSTEDTFLFNIGTMASQQSDNVSITGGSIAVTSPPPATSGVRNIIVSETEPVGMAEGDIWIEV